MKVLNFCCGVLFFVAGCLASFGALGNTGNPFQEANKPNGDRMDRTWKRYRNPNLGYCVSYPSRWARGNAFDGSGILVETGQHRYSKPTGEIDLGPMDQLTTDDARLQPISKSSLVQDLQEHLDGLKKFARAERVEVLDQHEMDLQGFKALYVKNKYYDPLERAHWMEEIVFVQHKGELFRFEMQCQPDQIKRFEPVFAYLVNSFEFDCK